MGFGFRSPNGGSKNGSIRPCSSCTQVLCSSLFLVWCLNENEGEEGKLFLCVVKGLSSGTEKGVALKSADTNTLRCRARDKYFIAALMSAE